MTRPESDVWPALLEAVERIAVQAEPAEPDLPSCVANCEVRRGIIVLEPAAEAGPAALAAQVAALGPPVAIDVVSPPPVGAGRPPWDSKRSIGHDVAGRRVWFGIETTDGVDRLVSVSIRFDGPPAEHLPPESREGPFRLTISLGWCGGHGEAVLDGARAIRRHDDLPVFVDTRSEETILGRVDPGGRWLGEPVIRIVGHGRLARRSERNRSIPGAPKQKYVALVVTSLDAARIEGERAGDSEDP